MEPYPQPQQYNDFDAEYHEPKKNVLGIVGFALSFCTGPIGLIISLIALKDRPRGFAIAGVIIGLISTIVIAGTIAFGGWIFNQFGPAGIAMADLSAKDLPAIQSAVNTYKTANNGALPPSLDALSLSTLEKQDPAGNAWGYAVSPDGTTWTLTWVGKDEQPGTSDDWSFNGDLTQDQLDESFEDYMEAYSQHIVSGGRKP